MTPEELNDKLVEVSMKMQDLLATNKALFASLRMNNEAQMQQARELANAYKDFYSTGSMEEWHPSTEIPEDKNSFYLALTKDNQPFITHCMDCGWIKSVDLWTYIHIPTAKGL